MDPASQAFGYMTILGIVLDDDKQQTANAFANTTQSMNSSDRCMLILAFLIACIFYFLVYKYIKSSVDKEFEEVEEQNKKSKDNIKTVLM